MFPYISDYFPPNMSSTLLIYIYQYIIFIKIYYQNIIISTYIGLALKIL